MTTTASIAKPPIRVVVAKPGLDGHDRGAKAMAAALRDAGMEVIYTGLHQTPQQIVTTALQEDAGVVGLSVLSGAHLALTRAIMAEAQARGLGDVLWLIGGTIPERDRAALQELGVHGIFPVGSRFEDVVAFIREHAGGER